MSLCMASELHHYHLLPYKTIYNTRTAELEQPVGSDRCLDYLLYSLFIELDLQREPSWLYYISHYLS